MARGILVTYSGYPYTMSSFTPDNGLANLAGALYAAGHEALIVDYGTVEMLRRFFPESVAAALRQPCGTGMDLPKLERELQACAERELTHIGAELCDLVRSYRPDFIGFKLWNGDGCIGSIALARTVRQKFPNIKIYGGGPHVMFAIKPIIAHTGSFAPLEDGTFDALVQSEAEDLIPSLADLSVGKASMAGIPNAIYRDDGMIRLNPVQRVQNLEEMAAPVYDTAVYPSMEGDGKLRIITLDESRGCPFTCNFCIQPLITGHRLRLRSARNVVDEMERCMRQYSISAFRFAGSATPAKLLEQIAGELLERGLRAHYTAFGRVNYTRDCDWSRMRQSGLESLFFGIESGSQRILDEAMGKRVLVEDMRRVLVDARKAGIFVVGSIITPAPGETEETWRETINFLKEVRPDAVPVCVPGPVAGTAWYTERDRFGIRIGDGFEEGLLDFKFRLLFPADQWEYPDYWVDGKNIRAIAGECAVRIRQIEDLGLLSMFSDEMYLMTCYCDLTPREFRDDTQRWLCSGQWEPVAALISDMNANIRTEARVCLETRDNRPALARRENIGS